MNLPNLPTELERVLEYLPSDTAVIQSDPGGMRWAATIDVKSQRFLLLSDRGYIDVVKEGSGPVPPPEDQRLSIAANQVAALIIGAL